MCFPQITPFFSRRSLTDCTSCRFLPKLFLHKVVPYVPFNILCSKSKRCIRENIIPCIHTIYAHVRIVNFVCCYLCIVGSKIQWPPVYTYIYKFIYNRNLCPGFRPLWCTMGLCDLNIKVTKMNTIVHIDKLNVVSIFLTHTHISITKTYVLIC